jgi:clan AA aspartic protease
MGLVYADVELTNEYDVEFARRYMMDEDEVKRMRVNMLVDSGAAMLCINENIQELLQFPIDGKKMAQTADGRVIECVIVKGVEVAFKNRRTSCRAIVLPGDSEPLLGVIPLEDMDVLIHPLREELIVNPDSPEMALMKLRTPFLLPAKKRPATSA